MVPESRSAQITTEYCRWNLRALLILTRPFRISTMELGAVSSFGTGGVSTWILCANSRSDISAVTLTIRKFRLVLPIGLSGRNVSRDIALFCFGIFRGSLS